MKDAPIAKVSGLKDGDVVKFLFVRGTQKRDGFLARVAGTIVAYENVCQHIAVNLDSEGGRILSRDGNHFVCQSHGALYEPLTGLCLRGPCEGEKLKKLELKIQGDEIWLAEKFA